MLHSTKPVKFKTDKMVKTEQEQLKYSRSRKLNKHSRTARQEKRCWR